MPRKWVDALFAKFLAIWPREWADRVAIVGADPMASEWAEGLAGLTPEQVRTAIAHCRNTLKWPPSIAEFREAARSGMTAEQRAMAARLAESDAERLALPSRTWADRRADGHRQAREMLARLYQGMLEREQVRQVSEPDDEPVTPEQIERIESAKRVAADALARMQSERDGAA